MNIGIAREEYEKALKAGQREYRELTSHGAEPYPAVLEKLQPEVLTYAIQDLPVMEIPADRIIGVMTEGRINAFTAGFLPLLDVNNEFATKWIALCAGHLDAGIRDAIVCYEYLGDFYVQEGNKRVSVLKYFGAPKILANVKRVIPPVSEEPRIKAYYEFLNFYKGARLYDIQFRKPGDYAKLLAYLGKEPGEAWSDEERQMFTSYYSYFRDAFHALGGDAKGVRAEEALLLWLHVYSFKDLGSMTAPELKKALSALWDDVLTGTRQEPVSKETLPPEESKGLLSRIVTPSRLNVAFIYQKDTETSLWTRSHDKGRQHLEEVLGDKVKVSSYFHADSPAEADCLLNEAVNDGAQVVFTTTPPLLRATLKAAVKYPKVKFLNCSADTPFASVRGYYCRAYEAKFIMGAIAGVMSESDRIGYISDYPILGVPASINAFALGAQMTNPKAKIILRWSSIPGNPVEELLQEGIRVISSRDAPAPGQAYLRFGEFGVYRIEDDGTHTPLGSPCWLWGRFYESVVRSILAGNWKQEQPAHEAVSYWPGMTSGVMDVQMSDELPEGVRTLTESLRQGLKDGTVSPFARKIKAQNGELMSSGDGFSLKELLHMDWLCENVEGSIPAFEELLPISQPLVRELGLHRESIPPEKEGQL